MTSLTLETVQWSSLKDIDDVEPINDGDVAALNDVRELLRQHGKLERFGICLLHRHFDVADDEVAIEYTDLDNRVSNVVVERREDKDRDAIQTMWRFQANGASMGTICVARCGKSGMTHSTVHGKQSV